MSEPCRFCTAVPGCWQVAMTSAQPLQRQTVKSYVGLSRKSSFGELLPNPPSFWRQHGPCHSGEGCLLSGIAFIYLFYELVLRLEGVGIFPWFAAYLYPSWIVQNILAKGAYLWKSSKWKYLTSSFPPKCYVCLFKESLAFLRHWHSRSEHKTSNIQRGSAASH